MNSLFSRLVPPLPAAAVPPRLLSACLWALVLCLVLAQSACVAKSRSRTGTDPAGSTPVAEPAEQLPKDLVLLHSEQMHPAANAHGETVFLTISDPDQVAGQLESRLGRILTASGFVLATNPSKAERIVTVKVLYKGQGSQNALKQTVDAGYDAPVASMAGQDSVLVADLLLVRRRVPKGKQMHNIATRNTVSSTSLRLGLASGERNILRTRSLEEALGKTVAGLAASDDDVASHKPGSLTPLKGSMGKSKKSSVSKSKKKARSSKKYGKAKKSKKSKSSKKAARRRT